MNFFIVQLAIFLCLLALPAAWGVESASPADFPAREKGRRALADGLYGPAEQFFREYRTATREREPAYTDATTRLIQILMQEKNTTAAVAVLAEYDTKPRRAASPNPHNWGKLELCRGAIKLEQGDLEGALKVFHAVAAGAAEDIRCLALEQIGNTNARLNRWPGAENAFNLILQHVPPPTPEQRRRAIVGVLKSTLATGQADRSQVALEELKKNGGDESTLALYRVLLLLATKKVDEAWSLFQSCMKESAVRQSPDFWMISRKMADALFEGRRFAEARDILERALTEAPTPADLRQTRLRMVECLIAQDKAEAAITALEAFRNDFPGTQEIIPAELKLADILRQSRSFLTAAEYYNSLAENEKVPQATRWRSAYNRALCLRDANQPADAAKAFLNAAKLGGSAEEKANPLYHAAESAFAAGDYAQASLRYQEVVTDFPTLPIAEKALFNQAISRTKEGNHAGAALLFRRFIDARPASTLIDQARIGLGRALKDAGDFSGAIGEFQTFIKTAGNNHPLVPEALLDAQEAADGANDPKQAAEFLSELLERHANSAFAPTALYRRTHLRFLTGEYAKALKDAEKFLKEYDQSPLCADVLMWIGDHYASTKKSEDGEAQYLKLISQYPTSPLAPDALFAAAKSAFERKENTLASKLVNQLLSDYEKNMPPAAKANAQLLKGDILAATGKYNDALTCFSNATEAMPDSPAAIAAQGRRAEMYYNLADDKPELMEKARQEFLAITQNTKASDTIRERARYRLAKAYEKLGQQHTDNAKDYQNLAIKEYMDIVYQYDIDVKAKKIRDWYYFARAGFDAAHLLVLNARFEEAARVYERLATAGIPESREARTKAREIREAHPLNN